MQLELPSWAAPIAVFDTETTGVYVDKDRIVSATLALIDSAGQVQERYDWLLDPGVEIPLAAARVHGITTEVARTSGITAATGIQQIVARLTEMLERGYALCAYNAPYDLSLLRAEAQRYGVPFPTPLSPVLDPLVLDKQLDRYRKGKRTLEVVCSHYGVVLTDAHDAGADAIAAGQVLQALANKYADKLPADLNELHTLQVQWAREQAESYQEWRRKQPGQEHFRTDFGWPVRD